MDFNRLDNFKDTILARIGEKISITKFCSKLRDIKRKMVSSAIIFDRKSCRLLQDELFDGQSSSAGIWNEKPATKRNSSIYIIYI